jgi:hypothetical protein
MGETLDECAYRCKNTTDCNGFAHIASSWALLDGQLQKVGNLSLEDPMCKSGSKGDGCNQCNRTQVGGNYSCSDIPCVSKNDTP